MAGEMKQRVPKGAKIAKTAGIILYIAVFAVLTAAMTLVYCWPAASNFVTQNILNQKAEDVEPGIVAYFKPAFATKEKAYVHSQEWLF